MENNQGISKTDLLLLLLYSNGFSGKYNEPIRGITRFMKLLYLIEKESEIENSFHFEPYKMGPFSSEVYPEIEFLKNFPSPDNSFLRTKPEEFCDETTNPEQIKIIEDINLDEDAPLNCSEVNTEFSLSALGMKVAEQLWIGINSNEKKALIDIKTNYGNMALRDLLRYVYKKYPDMTTKSIIKDQL